MFEANVSFHGKSRRFRFFFTNALARDTFVLKISKHPKFEDVNANTPSVRVYKDADDAVADAKAFMEME